MAQIINKRLMKLEEAIKARNEKNRQSLFEEFSDDELESIANDTASIELIGRFEKAVNKMNVINPEFLEEVIELIRLSWKRW